MEEEEEAMQAKEEEEESMQMEEEEEAMQAKEEEEEAMQMEEEEEAMQAKEEEEESMQMEEEEEAMQAKEEEEESMQMEEEEEAMQAKEEEEESMQMEEEEEAMQAKEEEEESMQMEEEEEAMQAKEEEEAIQAKRSPRKLLHRGLDLARSIRMRKGKGDPLSPEVRAKMERSFQADFGGVRIHTDQDSVKMNRAVGAKAFTTGKDIFFNQGRFDPSTQRGRLLLAHELTHTVQQGAVKEKKEPTAEPPQTDTDAATSAPAADPNTTVTPTDSADAGATVPVATPPTVDGTPVTDDAAAADGQAVAEEKPVPRKPGDDPNFQALKRKTKKTAAAQKTTPTAGSLAENAKQAAPIAGNEQKGQAQTDQVGEMDEQEPQLFDAATFKKLLLEQIKKILPKNEEEADKFPGSGKMNQVQQNAGQQVASEKEKAGGAIKNASSKEPDPASVTARPVDPLAPPIPGVEPKPLPAGKTKPPFRNNSEVKQPLVDDAKRMDDEMATNDVTEEQLAKSNEPEFLDAMKAKGTAKSSVETSVTQFRQDEQGVRDKHEQQAQKQGKDTTSEMFANRKGLLADAAGKQDQTSKDNTSERAKISEEINGIFLKTKTDVEKVLGPADGSREGIIDKEVNDRFDKASKWANLRFEGYIRRKMDAYKKERYGSWFDPRGWGKRIKDTFVGMPDEVNQFYVDAREKYIQDMDVALTGIAQYIATELGKVKKRIADGRKEVKDFVDSLPDNLQKLAKDAVENIEDKFSQLDSAVTSKQDALIDTIAQKYKESLDAVDARIKEMKEANKGLVDKAMDAIKGVIETIKKLKKLITDLLAAIQSLIGVIMADPIGFMKALFAGIKAGMDNFVANIKTHLIAGLFKWLTGALGPMGITLPKDIFSLPGIFSLVMQVLGLTWEFVRKKMVKLLTEPVVKVVETGFTIIKKIREKGVMGLWEEVKQQFSDLKQTVMESIQNMIITQVIQAGIKWVLSLLIPGAGFVKAIMAIKDVIVFFVESAIALIPTLINAIRAAAAKNFSGIAKAVEQGLSTIVPLVISLLAKLLGISGLVKKVQKIIKNIRKRIDRAVNKIILKAKKWAKKIMKKAKKKAKKIKDKIVQWWKAKKKFKGKDGKQHKLFMKKKGKGAVLMVASKITSYKDFIKHIESVAKTDDQKKKVKEAEPIAAKIDEIAKGPTAAPTKKEVEENKEKKQAEIQVELNKLSPIVSELFGFADGDQPDWKPDFGSTTKGEATVGEKMTAVKLSKKKPTDGSEGSGPTQANHKLFNKLKLRRDGGRSFYVRGHLLNENTHGPGQWKNMTPLSQQGNKNHLTEAENAVKKAVNSGAVVNYTVTPKYDRGDLSVDKDKLTKAGVDADKHKAIIEIRSAEEHVPTALTVKADLMSKGTDGKFTKVEKTLVAEKDVDNPAKTDNLKKYEVGEGKARENVHLLNDSAEKIAENVPDVDQSSVSTIQTLAIQLKKDKKLTSYKSISDAIDASETIPDVLKAALKLTVDKLDKAKNVKYQN